MASRFAGPLAGDARLTFSRPRAARTASQRSSLKAFSALGRSGE